ncbi:MAG: hypothetical protein ACRD12_21545 [Acidimicrobiales bacterium]
MVDIERLKTVLRDLDRERREAVLELFVLKEKQSALAAREANLAQAIGAIEKILRSEGVEPPQSATPEPPELAVPASESERTGKATDGPRGVEAVRRVLMEVGRPMDVKDIAEHLDYRGWIKSRDPVNATFSNAARAAEVLPDVERYLGEGGIYLYRYVESDLTSEDVAAAADVDSRDRTDRQADPHSHEGNTIRMNGHQRECVAVP